MILKEAIEYIYNDMKTEYDDSYYIIRDFKEELSIIDYTNPYVEELCNCIIAETKYFNHCCCGDPLTSITPVVNLLKALSEWKKWSNSYEKENGMVSYGSENWDFYWHKNKEIFKSYIGVEDVYENPLYLYVAYDLDRVGCTEHGSSIGGAWITELGEAILVLFEEWIKESKGNDN